MDTLTKLPPPGMDLSQTGHFEVKSNRDSFEKIDTQDVDLENKNPVRGDSSDGRGDWTLGRFLAILSLAAIYVGAQTPLYFVGGSLAYIVPVIGDPSFRTWLPVANTLAIACIAPLCGYLQDLFGRRYVLLSGGVLIIIGILLVAEAHSFGQAVTGMSFAGAGTAIGELTAIAGTSELVPVKQRGLYVAMIALFGAVFAPYILYTQLLASRWKWGLWISLIYNAIAYLGAFLFYFPRSHTRAEGVSKKDLLKRIDYLGAFLLILGLTLFLVGLQSGGQNYLWGSAYVLCQMLIGLALIAIFIVWEWKGAKYPIIPHELFAGQNIMGIAFVLSFVSGILFYSFINFLPQELTTVFPSTKGTTGVRGLGPALSYTLGSITSNAAISLLKGRNRELLVISTIVMTAFSGALSVTNPNTVNTFVALATITGFGVGGVVYPAATIAITVSPDHLIGTAMALSIAIRTLGGSIGYTSSIYYNIFYTKITDNIPIYIAQYAVEAGLPRASAKAFVQVFVVEPAKAATIQGVTPAILEAAALGSRWAYAESLKYVWYVSIAPGVCSIVVCLFLPNMRKFMTQRIAAKIGR
ncbi:hypothetical protein MMC13_001906 [Lambiella insularis]|nr:hypothetical protein [Lambiella insularis]